MKHIFIFISLGIIGIGFYFMFFYDVPDVQVNINFFSSWFLVIVGVASLLVNLFWQSKKKE